MNFKKDVSLAPYTTFKIGGPAELFYEAATIEEIVAAVIKGGRQGYR